MISQRVRTIQPSATLSLNAKLQDLIRNGSEILNLSVGEPDFPTPEFIRERAKQAIDEGWTRYTAASGHIEARQAICRHIARTRKIEVEPSQVVISSGAKQSLSQCLLSLVDPADEVLLGAPHWVSYPELIRLADGVPVTVKTDSKDGHRLTPELLEPHLTPRTTGLILNEPGNPTGTVSSADDIAALVEFARANDLWIISDEIYESLIHDGELHSPFSVDPQRVSLISGLSKSFSMTGWRIGWTVCNEAQAAAMGRLQSQNSANPCSVSQACIATALEHHDHPELLSMYETFRVRRDLLVEGLSGIPGVHFSVPGGAFYIFLDLSERLGSTGIALDAEAFAVRLLEEKGVAVVPGPAFGSEGAIRISFARPEAELRIAITRIRELLCES
ncbi:MAG: pyridoxal phosphate-dependent aminotransferase [Planctomycetota bacterium]|nr:pyridoxal phosphate-dependent aminotransferase [Planctomycetota bacterium]